MSTVHSNLDLESTKMEEDDMPMNWTIRKKSSIALFAALATFMVAFSSSVYSGAQDSIQENLGGSQEVITLGISLFVFAFALGPLIWAPLSEIFGRKPITLLTMAFFTLFNGLCAGSTSLTMLLVSRFLASCFASSMFSNGGAIMADMFSIRQRGLAMAAFAAAPFTGPCLAPVIGNVLSQAGGFRWVEGLLTIMSGIAFFVCLFFIPETYAEVIQKRNNQSKSNFKETFLLTFQSCTRPFVILIQEPIVLILSLYQGVIYAILYSFFAAFPIVYGQVRGWSNIQASLPFLSILIGTIVSLLYVIFYDNRRYQNQINDDPQPEHRLPPACVAAPILPITLACFAGLDSPLMPWIASVIFACPFGFAMVLLFLSTQTYIVDAYGQKYAASSLAAVGFTRSVMGGIFPLITRFIYSPGGCDVAKCGIHAGPGICAAIALLFTPAPFLFSKYGSKIRSKGKFTKKE